MSKTLISRVDYQQIFRMIYAVLLHEKLDLTRSCVAFNVIGAVILNEFYGIDARPFAGIAAYCVCSEPRALIVFASERDGIYVPDDGGCHCWIETKDWVIDFAAPIFPLIVNGKSVPDPGPKMMQRKIIDAKESLHDLAIEGDFFVHPNQDFTKHVLKTFAQVPFHHDLIEVCRRWYVKPPKLMKPEIVLANERGEMASVIFPKYQVVGSW